MTDHKGYSNESPEIRKQKMNTFFGNVLPVNDASLHLRGFRLIALHQMMKEITVCSHLGAGQGNFEIKDFVTSKPGPNQSQSAQNSQS